MTTENRQHAFEAKLMESLHHADKMQETVAPKTSGAQLHDTPPDWLAEMLRDWALAGGL